MVWRAKVPSCSTRPGIVARGVGIADGAEELAQAQTLLSMHKMSWDDKARLSELVQKEAQQTRAVGPFLR